MAEPLDFSAFGIPADDETGAPAQGVLDFSAEGEAADAVDTVPIPQPKPTRAPFEPPQPQTAIAPPQERKPMAPGATRPRPTLTRDMQKHVKDMKLINGEWYSRNDLGIIAHFDESGIPDQVTGDPEILKHFGQSKPTKAAALALKNQEAGLINQPKDKATTVQKYTQEASKAFGKGAVDIVGTALKGFAGLTTDNPRRVQEVEQGLATMGQMDDAQFADFVARIPENMDINPIAAINYQMAARAARKGEKQTASEYLETARKSTNTAPLEEQQAYKLGEKVQGSVAGDEFKPRPGWEKSITVQLGQAGGSMAAFVPLSILGGPAASGIFGVSAGSGEAVENAEQALGTSTRDDRAGPYNAGLGAGADEQVLRAGKLGVAPGATDAIPVEALVQRLPQMIPGLRQVAKSGGWDRFSKMVGQIVTQMAIEGGQEAGQQYLQNLIQQLTLVPEKDLTEDMLQSFLIGGAVGGIAEAPVAGYEAAVGGREGAPAPDAGTPPPDKQPAPTPNTATKADMEAPTPDKTAASADIAPTPMSGPEQAALLAGAGYTLEDVRSMTPEEYRRTIEELRQQGATAKPGAELQSEKPKPGTAPMAPKLKKQGPDIELPVVPGWPIQEETAAPIEDYSADTDLESYIDDAVRSGVAPDQVAKEMAEAGAPEGAIAYTTRRMARLAAEQTPPTGELSETSVQLPEPLDFSGESIDPGDGTRAKPAKVADESDMQAARDLVASEPTEAQKEAGNYKKGHVKVHGLDITLETPKGGKRTGKNPDGTEWSVDMQDDYGYVKRTEGADGEQVDVFLGPNHGSSRAFIVNQVDPETGKFDEHKIVLGADHERQARNIYERAFSDGSGDRRMGGMEEMDVSQLKDWLATPQTEPASAKTPEAGPETAPEPAIGYTSAPDDDFDAAFDQAVAEQFDAPQGRKEPGLPAVKDRLIVQVGSRRFEAESLAQASQAYTDTVDATGSTSSGQTGPAAPKAIILDKDGNQIAHIAYNGRVWAGKAEDWKSGDTPLYDPRKAVTREPDPETASVPDGWSAVGDETLRHYARGYGVKTEGRSRGDIIKDMQAEGAKPRQSGGIISNDIEIADVPRLLRDPGQTTPKLFEDFKAALTAHPEKLSPSPYDPKSHWRLEAKGPKGDQSLTMDIAVYGRDGVQIVGGSDARGMGYMGSTYSDKLAATFMRQFIKESPPGKVGQKKGKEKQPVKPAVDEKSRGDEKIVHPDTSLSAPASRSKKGSKPLSLLQFIAWNGGIREEKGEMAARNLEKKFLPGFGRLVRKNGKSHSSVLESAIQEGYLSDPSRVDGSESQVTVNDLYAAIDAEHGGKPVYADARDAQTVQEKAEAKQVKQTEQELERYSPDERVFIEKHGFEIFEDMHIAMTRHDLTWTDWTPDALDAAGRLMKGGMDAMDALERGATSLETPEAVELANDQEADIPYDDEVLEGTASEGGEGLRASGAEDQGPRDEGAPREVRQEPEEPGEAGQPAEGRPLSPFVDRVRALLDQEEIEKPEIYALVKVASIDDLPALHELAEENADWDWLGALDMVVDELRDKVVPPLYSPGGNSKKKLAEYEARKEQAAAAKAKFQPTYDLIKEKRAAAIVRTMEETGFRPGDVVEFTDTVIDTRDGHEMKRAVRGPIAYRDGDTHAQIHDQGGVLFLTPTDFRQYLKKSAPADEFDAAFDAAVDLQFGDDGTVQPFDPARHIKLVADDVSKVRKPDLERLFDEAPKDRDAWHDLRVYLIDNRPELAGDVFDAMDIVGIPVEEESSAAKQERTDRRARLKEKAQRIYDFVANGGKVAFTTHTKHVPIKDTSVLQIRDDGLYVARGKQWDYVLEPQLDQMLTLLPKVRAKAPNLRRGRERIENDISLFQQVAAEGQSPAQRERGRKRVEELKAELAALPTEESGADNKPQTVIPGAEKIGDAKLAQRRADAPLRPQVVQKPIESGLFGDEHNQTDMLAAPRSERTAGQAAASAVKNAAMGLDEVASGLFNLFNDPNKLGSGPSFDEETYKKALPFFRAGAAHFAAAGRDSSEVIRLLVRYLAEKANMTRAAIENMRPYVRRFMEDIRAGKETLDALPPGDDLESDRGATAPEDGLGEADVPAARGRARSSTGTRGEAGLPGDERPGDSGRLSESNALALGEPRHLEIPRDEPEPTPRADAAGQSERSGGDGREGLQADRRPDAEAVGLAEKAANLAERRRRQAAAEPTKVKLADKANVAETLPMLFPEQQDDVLRTEQRFEKPDGHGMLLTNGTGTGKTFSGLGVAKRFHKRGKRNILVVAPSQGILLDWQRSAADMQMPAHILQSLEDKGADFTLTTYANLGQNLTLADREWDLIITDESHKLSSDKDGTITDAAWALRALTGHPDGFARKAEMVFRKDWERVDALQKIAAAKGSTEAQRNAAAVAYKAYVDKTAPYIAKWRAQPRNKVLMMSATPFAYHFSVDYAEGYLFSYGGERRTDEGYNSGDGRDRFYMQNFGYRMRYNKLTKPEADVNSEIMERQFHEKLKAEGSLWGRALEIDKDYDRRFVLVESAIGREIDRAMDFLNEAENGRYQPLAEAVAKRFDYLARMRLLEAINARSAVSYIKASHALGRKVVVMHGYNEGGGFNPFHLEFPADAMLARAGADGKRIEEKAKDVYAAFLAQNPYVLELQFADYLPPIAELKKHFPDALVYNGTVSVKERDKAKKRFNDESDKGANLIVVQAAAGEAGISLHDIEGLHQRVLINLGMPIRPTTSIQQEGRIYRVGNETDALFRYFTTGTNWERWTFAGKIAERAGTAENLALGNQARTIRQSFIDAYAEADFYPPEPGEGKGGKERDRALTHDISEYEKAKTFYFANAKNTKRRDNREGIDYFATPEPLGLKMVEWANVKPGEKILEPSAGHGAIARFFPETTARTLVEPASGLASRAALYSPNARVIVDRFENLDLVNKYDAIVMNPPFGQGGSTAIQHLAKAARHLRNGGRIVAIIPSGPAADERLEKWNDGDGSKDIYVVGNITLPSVTFERAGTSARARVIILEKQTQKDDVEKFSRVHQDLSGAKTIGEFFDRLEHIEVVPRVEPAVQDIDEIPVDGRMTVAGIEFRIARSSHDPKDTSNTATPLNKIGGRFAEFAKAADAAGGHWSKTLKAFLFRDIAQLKDFFNRVANPPAAPAAPEPQPVAGVTFKLADAHNEKLNKPTYVASIENRVEREAYDQVLAVAKKHGGYYSSFARGKAVPGFQFSTKEARAAFLAEVTGGTPQPTPPAPKQGTFEQLERVPDRFRPDLSEERRAEVIRTVQQLANQIFGRSLRLGVVDELENGSQGRFDPNLNAVIVAVRASLNAVETLGHEAIHGLRDIGAITKPEWAAISRWAREAILPTFKDAQKYRDYYGSRRPNLTPAQLEELVLEEAVAEHFGRFLANDQATINRTPTVIANVFARIREFLTRLRNYLAGAGFRTPADIFAGIARGEKRNAPAQESSREFDLESLPDYVGEAQSTAIDEVLAGARPRTPIMFRTVPRVFAVLGVKDTPVAVAPSVVWKAVDKHGMTGAQVKAALNGLADPMAVFDSATEAGAFVAVVEVAGLDGLAAIAIHPDEKVGRIEISRIASIHDRPAPQVFNWLDQGLARYLNKRKTDAWLRSAGLQLPGDGSVRHRLGKKILRFGDVFKPKGTFESLRPGGRMPKPGPNAPTSFVEPQDDAMTHLTNRNIGMLARIRGASAAALLPARRAMQDDMADQLRVEKAIAEQHGPINPALMAYRAHTLYSGRAGTRLEEMRDQDFEPLFDEMVKRGVTHEEIDDFLYARHAPERNAHVASINPLFPDGGSGMLNAEAQQIMAAFISAGKMQDMMAVAAIIDRINQDTRDRLLAGGLIDQPTWDSWTNYYQYWVPLQGFEQDPDEDSRVAVGQRYDTRVKLTHAALGRSSRADSPFAYIIAKAQQSVILAEKARANTTLFRLARSFPNPKLWTVNQVVMRRFIDPQTGLVTSKRDGSINMRAVNVVAVRIGGRIYTVTLHHKGLAEGWKGMEAAAMPSFMRALASIGRYLAITRTGINPEFFIPNFIRDAATAGIHITADQGTRILRQTMKNIPKAMRGVWQESRGRTNSQWAQYAEEFKRAGGSVGIFGLKDVESIKNRIAWDLWKSSPGMIQKTVRGASGLYDFMIDINGAVENAVRLSLYVAMRQNGASQDEAAYAAKEVTVNFNRKGQWGAWLNAGWLFFNASVQGTARVGKALATSKVARRAAYGLLVAGFIQDVLNSMMSGDDDDDGEKDYDQLPEHVRERNMVILVPGTTKAITIPMPWVYNVFHYAGTNMSRLVRGKISPTEAMTNIGGALLQAANPVQSSTLLQMVSPTIVDPIGDIQANTDWKGDPIYPDRGDLDKRPDSQKYYRSVDPIWKGLTDFLNNATGGDEVRPGSIDVSPESVEYIADFIAGGVGTFYNNIVVTANHLIKGESVDIDKVPIIRRLITDVRNPRTSKDEYYRIVDAVSLTMRQIEFYRGKKGNDPERAREIAKDYPADVRIDPMLKSVKKALEQLKAKQASKATAAEKEAVSEEMDAIMAKVRARYRELLESTGQKG